MDSMDIVDRIEDPIVAGSEGFFDEADIRECLHITIRIAKDFYDFLVKFGERPPAKEIAYVMDTIRSGIDWFFRLADLCVIINTGRNTWKFDPHRHWDFPALREKFLGDFEDLAESPDISVVGRLASLLALTHLELVFLAQNFPSAIFEGAVDDPQSSAEFLLDLAELREGRLTFDDVMARASVRYKCRS
jgi:hypothetical protein